MKSTNALHKFFSITEHKGVGPYQPCALPKQLYDAKEETSRHPSRISRQVFEAELDIYSAEAATMGSLEQNTVGLGRYRFSTAVQSLLKQLAKSMVGKILCHLCACGVKLVDNRLRQESRHHCRIVNNYCI